MSPEIQDQYRRLIEAAKQASACAYQPYSNYSVGAAVLTFDGEIYAGCNIENASYTQTIHAEQTAMAHAIVSGALNRALQQGLTQFEFIKAVAVYTPKGSDPWPCCNCRQSLSEFGLNFDIIGEAADGSIVSKKLSELIPHPFPIEKVLASIRGAQKATVSENPAVTAVAAGTTSGAALRP